MRRLHGVILNGLHVGAFCAERFRWGRLPSLLIVAANPDLGKKGRPFCLCNWRIC